MEKLYHFELGFPKHLTIRKVGPLKLKYSRHAQSAAKNDRYGIITLPETVVIEPQDLIEIGMVGEKPTKIVVRQAYDVLHDIIIVMNTADNLVRTVWLNRRSDLHKTLDVRKYCKP